MDERQHRAIEESRKRLVDLKAEVATLSANRVEESDPKMQKAMNRLRQSLSEYALYRLREGLGSDPLYIDDRTFEETLRGMINKSRMALLSEKALPMRIGVAARHALLLSGFSFAEALNFTNDQQGEMLSFLNERSPLKNALRRWVLQAQDPYIQETVAQLHRLSENYENTVSVLKRRVDRLRHRYEEKQKKPDRLEMMRQGSRIMLCASDEWTNLVSAFPEDAGEVYGIFRSLEQQLKGIDEIKELLNAEVRKFMSALVPMYLAYVEQQSKEARRAVLGRASLSLHLAERMMREASQVDYLLGGAGLPVPHPTIPPEFSAIRKFRDYQNFKRSAGIEQLQKQDTVEFPTNR